MGLNLGQTLSSMGIIASRQREAENEVMRQRQLELQTQELNAQQRMRAELGQSAQNLANAPLMQFAQAPGAAYGTPEVPAPAAAPAPVAAPKPAAGLQAPPAAPAAAPAAPAAPAAAKPAAGLQTPGVDIDRTTITRQLSAAQMKLDQLKGPWYLPTPESNKAQIAETEAEIARLKKQYQDVVVPAARAEYMRVNPQYRYPQPSKPMDGFDVDTSKTKPVGKGAPAAPAAPAADVALQRAQQYDAAQTGYDQILTQAAQANGIDPVIFKRLIGTESSFRPDAVSPRGEKYGLGIAQIAAVHGLPRNDMLNPEKAIPFAAQLFSKYLKEANGDYAQAIMEYKGATSDKGRQSMQGAVDTILANGSAAPKKDVTTAAKTGTAKDVAEAVVESLKPASGGTMYGAQALDPSMRNPVIQQTLAVRKALQDQVAIYSRYGRGDLAMAEAAKIQAIDLGLYKGQADIGLYEGATTGNFSRAMSVLSAFTGAPHQVLQRPDGKGFDLYINGKVAKAGLKGDQVEMLVRTQVDAEYRKQLASVQAERGMEEFKSGLRIKEKASEITLNTAKEIQKAVVEGNVKLAEKKLEMAGFKAVSSGAGDGKVTYSNGLGEFFVIDTVGKEVEVNGVKIGGPQAQRVGIDTRSIWSSVNAPNATSQ